MPPKKGNKKSKKQDDDDFWATAGESIPSQNVESNENNEVSEEDEPVSSNVNRTKNAFAAMAIDDGEDDGEDDDEDEDVQEEQGKDDDNVNDDNNKQSQASPQKQQQQQPKEEEQPRLLSKKEKEKLKKEKEKAKKKAQAANKKPQQKQQQQPKEEEPSEQPEQPEQPKEEEQTPEQPSESSKKNKKKNKSSQPKEEPPSSKKGNKKPTGGLAALRAQIEANKAKEEERKRKEEEERLLAEEEERLAIEAEIKEEEEKQRKKDKDKAKREQAKKEGRYLTDKQKKERAAGEARRQALLASGVKVAGLEQNDESQKPKRPVYGKKPAKKPQQQNQQPAKQEEKPKEVKEEAKEAKPKEDNWDDSSSDDEKKVEKPQEQQVNPGLDDWDASSSEDEKPQPQPKESTDKLNQQKPQQMKDESESEESESESESESDDEEKKGLSKTEIEAQKKKEESHERRIKRHEEALAQRSATNLRSPICCILGHVDTGKTKVLDKIRQTNVQEGEAGGITQQIGATYFPIENIIKKVAVLDEDGKQEYKLPGLLVIDTPGHESFTNLRSRGSSLCNIAVLVVDIMHGLEPQTLESLRLLRDKKTPFIVALNKIDRLYGWKATPNNAFRHSLKHQSEAVKREFKMRLERVQVEFAEQGLNSSVYYENKNFGKIVSLVPTSAHTGEGIPDMLQLLINLTQSRMSERLMYLSELECTVLEVKVIEGLGTTVDVVLSNGILREGDKVVLCGLNGPIVTQIRALLTPQPMKEMRIKGAYIHHKEIRASMGVKITAPDLDKAVAGSRLLVVNEEDDEEDLKEEVMSDLQSLLSLVDKSGRGVCVQASTLGSLEALLDFLKVSKIPVSGINIGPVYRKDVLRAGIMLEKAKEFATILAFDVPVDKEAEKYADEIGVRIFKADIIYHLFDQFTAYNKEIVEEKRKEAAPSAVWPVRLKVLQAFVRRDPIIVGCDIIDGTLRVGTPICVATVNGEGKKDIVHLGRVGSIEINHKSLDMVKKSQTGAGVAVKIDNPHNQAPKMIGRHFQESDILLSHISRQSIDVLKESFRNDLTKEDLHLIKRLKQTLDIP